MNEKQRLKWLKVKKLKRLIKTRKDNCLKKYFVWVTKMKKINK